MPTKLKPKTLRVRRIDATGSGSRVDAVQIVVPGRAVPWKAPTYGKTRTGVRTCYSPKAYRAWKRHVRTFACLSMLGKLPLEGNLTLNCTFFLVKTAHDPDLTNVVKALEDGLQGVVFENDNRIKIQLNIIIEVQTQSEERVEVKVSKIK